MIFNNFKFQGQVQPFPFTVCCCCFFFYLSVKKKNPYPYKTHTPFFALLKERVVEASQGESFVEHHGFMGNEVRGDILTQNGILILCKISGRNRIRSDAHPLVRGRTSGQNGGWPGPRSRMLQCFLVLNRITHPWGGGSSQLLFYECFYVL